MKRLKTYKFLKNSKLLFQLVCDLKFKFKIT